MTRLKLAFQRFLPMFIWLILFACLTGGSIPAAAQNADGSPEVIYSEEEYLELTGDSREELMEAAYENKNDIRDRVAKVVSTYHPADNSVSKPQAKGQA